MADHYPSDYALLIGMLMRKRVAGEIKNVRDRMNFLNSYEFTFGDVKRHKDLEKRFQVLTFQPTSLYAKK